MNIYPKKGFTLIEILLVVAAISILASIVIVAINPARQLGQTRDVKRKSDIATIINAVYQYYIDNNALPAGIPLDTPKEICDNSTTGTICTNAPGDSPVGISGVDLKTALVATYIVSIPSDPKKDTGASLCSDTGSCYTIVKDANNRITVATTSAEQSATEFSVSR